MRTIRLITLLAMCALILSCGQQAQEAAVTDDVKPKDGVFIHVSHGPEDSHRVLMALQMATIMSETNDVLVYFDIRGIEVVLKDAADLQMSPFLSSHTAIEKLVESGVRVIACPGCLEALGKTPADLMPGVQVADREYFFGFTDGRILTLDY